MTGMGGALAAPVTAYIYDWNMLPLGQLLWLKELETYKAFPSAPGDGSLQPGRDHRRNEGVQNCEPRGRIV